MAGFFCNVLFNHELIACCKAVDLTNPKFHAFDLRGSFKCVGFMGAYFKMQI
jgi:hypothetical protein